MLYIYTLLYWLIECLLLLYVGFHTVLGDLSSDLWLPAAEGLLWLPIETWLPAKLAGLGNPGRDTTEFAGKPVTCGSMRKLLWSDRDLEYMPRNVLFISIFFKIEVI